MGMVIGSCYCCIPKLVKNQENAEMKILHKIIVLILTLILIVNITLFALSKIDESVFWIIIIFAAVFAYKILPRIRK